MTLFMLPLLMVLDAAGGAEVAKCVALKENDRRLACYDAWASAPGKTATVTGAEVKPFAFSVVSGKPWSFLYAPNPRVVDQPSVWLVNLETGKVFQLVNNQKFYQVEVSDTFIGELR